MFSLNASSFRLNLDGDQGASILRITDLPDPYRRYAELARSRSEIAEAKVATPNVHDCNRVLITPGEYDSKIKDGDYVEVEIFLKL
jgi:hypothetical protein